MKIIKMGKVPEVKENPTITCDKCDTVFQPGNSDYKQGQHGMGTVVACPLCGQYHDVD